MTPTLRRSLLALAASLTPALAQQPAAPAPAAAPEIKPLVDHIDLKDGDTWVFLGDSITHQCLYTQYVEDYYYTRYPKVRVHFHNAGVGGDRAQDALNRFDGDVASFKPKYVTILLGMNDGAYTNYQQPVFDTYQKGMTTLLDKIAELGATAIPMTPTMFDALVSRKGAKPNPVKEMYYNGVLSLYGSWLREETSVRGLGFVDMWGPLNDLTFEKRKKEAAWTMIPDAVHPAPTGQVVMAEAIVHDVVPHTAVSQITVDTQQGKPAISAARGVAGNLQKDHNSAAFDFTAESLPWVLPPDAAEGFMLTHAGHHDSNEKVTVRDLAPGRYDLKIDGQPIGTYAAGQLAFGVELEGNDKTPQYQQALKVALLNKARNDQAMHPLRDLWRDRKIKLRDVSQAEGAKAANLAEVQAAFAKFDEDLKPRVQAMIEKVKGFEDQIYEANQPVAHHYEIVAAQPPAAAAAK